MFASALILYFCSPELPAWGMVSTTIKMGFHISINLRKMNKNLSLKKKKKREIP